MTDRLIVEADGGSRGNPGPAGFGALVRDAVTGRILSEAAEFIGTATNNVAEYRGLIAGLALAAELNPKAAIEVRMDSKLVVEQMSGRWKIKHPDMQELARTARSAAARLDVTYTWIPRERNGAADRLANAAMDAASGSTRPAPIDPDPGHGRLPPDLGAPTSVVLLRHGVTALTRERRYSGSGGEDHPLTELGRAQAVAAAQGIAQLAREQEFAAIVCSPLLRAQQTAQAAADAIGLPVRVSDDWRECDFGEWDGLTSAEVAQRWPTEFADWSGSIEVAPPGGESLAAVGRRVHTARDKLLARYPRGRVLVVCHAVPIKVLAGLAAGAPAEMIWRLDLSPASICLTHWWTDGNAALLSFNETGHLRSAELPLT
ncbi:MAG: bifunctional RNase H/acid phosphatase [Angustibacter sp.]